MEKTEPAIENKKNDIQTNCMARQITLLSFNQLVGEVTRLIAEGRRTGDRFAMESHNPGKSRPEVFYKRGTGCHLRNLTRPIHGKGMGIFSAKKKDTMEL